MKAKNRDIANNLSIYNNKKRYYVFGIFLITIIFAIIFHKAQISHQSTAIPTSNQIYSLTNPIGKNPLKNIEPKIIIKNNVFRSLIVGDLIYDRWVYKRLKNDLWLKNHFGFRYAQDLIYQGVTTSLREVAQESDFVWLNLETPIGKFWSWEKELSVCQKSNKSIAFCSHEDILPVIKSLGFTMVNLANNHSLDAWIPAHLKTIELLNKYGIKYFGYIRQGPYFEKNYVYTGEKHGNKFAWHGYDYTVYSVFHRKYCEDLQFYKEKGYTNFVVVHRWPEYIDNHTADQEAIAKELISCGADTIFGGHPHVIQDTQVYSWKAVLYSIGNFLFDQDIFEKTKTWGYVIFDAIPDTNKFYLQTGTINALARKSK